MTTKRPRERQFKRLYFDIETTPNIVYSWNVGYNLTLDHSNIITERAIICACYKWEGESKVYSLTWDKGDDHQLVYDLLEVLSEADEVVGHNGDRYDLRWFRTRALYHGIKAIPEIKSIDTLKIAKDKFRFNSNRLDYIAKFLGFDGKIKTEFDLWKRVMAYDKKALTEMVTYCKWDVELLEKVYKKLAGYTKVKTHMGVAKGGTKCDCPACGGTNTISRGNAVSGAGTIVKKMECRDCETYFNVAHATYKKQRETV